MFSIEEMMTNNVHTLRPEHTLYDAKRLIIEKHIRHIPIVDEQRKVLGLVSQRDVLAASISTLAAQDNSTKNLFEVEKNIPVEKFMISHVIKTSKRDSLRYAALMMIKRKIGCLLIVDDEGSLEGIITDSDYVSIALNLIEQLEELDDRI